MEKQTGNELDDFYQCSRCGCSNESCRCEDEQKQRQEEVDFFEDNHK